MDRKQTANSKKEQRFKALAAFKRQHGHCNVSSRYLPDPQLAHWVQNLRSFNRAGRLDEETVKRLDGMGFCWAIRTHQSGRLDWDEALTALRVFKKQHGHCCVPKRWWKNLRLASWVRRMRKAKRENQLTATQIRQLDGLGFTWGTAQEEGVEQVWEQRWEQMYAMLAKFRKRYGHCRGSKLSPAGTKLGSWVRTQRAKRRKGTLSADRVRRLDQLGFVWDATSE